MKVTIGRDEWWPVYDLDKDISYISNYTRLVDISKELWDEYIEASERFIAIQSKLADIYEKHKI
jgi:hypothetical protein